jgi:hypothetical protein
VKLQGFRIELGEIEAALTEQASRRRSENSTAVSATAWRPRVPAIPGAGHAAVAPAHRNTVAAA